MARRRVNEFVEVDGPLFDEGVILRFKDALAAGMKELGEEGAGIMMGFIAAGGFERTGAFLHSVDSFVHRDNRKGAGWVKIWPTHAFPEPVDAPTRTWMETGERGGVRLRKGIYAFRKTAQRLNTIKNQGMLPRLVETLDG